MNRALCSLFLITILSSTLGCSSLIFGNIKPFEEKSKTYSIIDLSKANPAWIKLPSARSDKRENSDGNTQSLSADSSDMAFREKKSGSTILMNSTCKNYPEPDKKPTLQKLTHELLAGIFPPESTESPLNIPTQEERNLILQDTPALETITKGQIGGQDYAIETVVLRSDNCIYDMIYISRADQFAKNEKVFTNFVSSLRFK